MSVCCQEVVRRGGNESPFHRIVALGYYDGPTDGVAQCAACQRSYRFDMLDWDGGQEVRVFAFALLEPEHFRRLVEALTTREQPKWPVWVPSWRGDSGAEAEAEVAAALSSAGRYELVLATHDLGSDVLAAKSLEGVADGDLLQPGSLDSLKGLRDWLSFLGLRA